MGYEGTTGTHIVWSYEACNGVWGGKNSGFDYIRIFLDSVCICNSSRERSIHDNDNCGHLLEGLVKRARFHT
jgi:hypothetical protein